MFILRTTWTWQVRKFMGGIFILVFQALRRILVSRRKFTLLFLYLIRTKQDSIRVEYSL